MSAGERLEQYLTDVRRRLRAVVVARASAVVALTALIITVLAIVVLRNPGFPDGAMLTARLALFAALLVAAGAMLWRPLLALAPRHRTRTLERHLPAQGGRIETWHETMSRRAQGFETPLADLLAEDALAIADRAPADEVVPPRRALVPAVLGGVAVLALAFLLAFGPSEWGFGSRNLWFGTSIPKEQLALRRIAVTPGNTTVRRNQDVPIRATVSGFKASDAEVYVRFGDAKTWERAQMRAADDGKFEFTVYALREPLSYYVSAQGVKSAEHLVGVTDVPRIERMRLTYSYPSWTGLPSETDEVSRDIRAVAGTKVSVEVQTSAPLDSPTLTVDNTRSSLTKEGAWSRGVIDVTKEGHYRLSARVGDELVPLTDEHEITIVDDQQPTVEFARPGRDWQASSIEEVPVQVHARDDFRIDSVELHYSVNGGEWKTAPLKGRGKDVTDKMLFKLEDMGEKNAEASEPRLTPGDLVTYYAVAKDRRQSAKTDLFLIHVQPFERRFTQGQAGGGGGGGGDDQQNVISQRQREILLATWNLQRAKDRQKGREAERVEENARMLSEAQGTLADQARTLIERAKARGVDSADAKNRELLDNLEQAAKAMQPAAKHLNDVALQDAIPQEQKALQHLLRAEALYSDIEVQFRQASGGGGGGSAGRDLAEMFELEMDLDKNQYETESRAAGDESPQQLADALRKLQELARRQEQLAREAARQQQGPRESERWKQEQLKRETEDLRKQLQQLAQQQNSNSPQGQGQGQSQGEGQQGGQAQGGSQSSTASTAAQALDQVQRALQNMQGASGEQQRQQGQQGQPGQQGQQGQRPPSPEQLAANARAAQQASRNLKQALERLEQGRREGMAGEFDDLAARAARLTEEQRKQQEELLNAFSGGGNPQSGAGPGRARGLSWERAEALAEQKRSLQSELESLQRDMQGAAQQHRDDAPDASARVGNAAKDVAESNLSAGLTRSAMELERGRGVQAAAREQLITGALENLENDLSQAARVAANEARQQRSQKNEASPEELLAELSELRRAWQLAQAGQPGRTGQRGALDPNAPNGQQNPNGQTPGQSPDPNGQNGQSQNGQSQNGQSQGGQQSGGQQGGSPSSQGGQGGGDQAGSANEGGIGSPNGGGYANRGGAWGGGNWGGYAPYDRGPLGAWNPPLATNALRPGESPEFNQQAEEIGRRLRALLDRLPQNALAPADINALRQLSTRLRRGDRDRMESEYGRMLGLVDQLELAALSASEKNRDTAATRTANPTAEAPEYRETVAEYYRRLGGTSNK